MRSNDRYVFVALLGGLLTVALTTVIMLRVLGDLIDLLPAHVPDEVAWADRTDATDTSLPFVVEEPDAGTAESTTVVSAPVYTGPAVTPNAHPHMWSAFPCRGCGPRRFADSYYEDDVRWPPWGFHY